MTADVTADFTTTATRVGCVVWFQRRLFEVLGAWVTNEVDARAKALLATHSRHHAWRADVLLAELPLLGERTPASFVVPSDPELSSATAALAEVAGTTERLALVFEAVVPTLVLAYEGLMSSTGPIADAPLRRAVRIVERDEMDDLAEGRALLAQLGGRHAVDAARLGELTGRLAGLLPER